MVIDYKNEKWRVIDGKNFIYRSNFGREKQRLGVRFDGCNIIFDDEVILFDNEEFFKDIERTYEGEDWKDWGNYQISNYGRVKHKGIFIYVPLNEKGYRRLNEPLHRIVAKLFIPNDDENKNVVDHINTIRHDNRAVNLRWVTNKENYENPITMSRLDKYPNFKKFVFKRFE